MHRCRWVASRALATAPLAISLLLPASVFGQALPGADPLSAGLPIPPVPGLPAARAITRDSDGHPTVRAFRVGEEVVVDGRLDERFYEMSPPFDDLIQAVPVSRGAPSERTDVWIGFDAANLYVAARVWEMRGEAGWIANEMRRDSTQLRANDSFGIYFDTYHDRRNAVGFFVNPIGGFAEVQITNQATPNFDWNPVWDVATGRFDGGWTVEMAIPFKSLRYRPGVEQTWGVQIRRSVLRSNEWSYLTAVPIQVAGSGPNAVFRVSMYGDLVGIEAPPPGLNLEVKPFATSRISTDRVVVPAVENDWLADAGLDVKYAVTQNLALDLTVNTDFAQVEVDEQQVNLTRFNLLFPEKREFFLEGRGVYDFGIGRLGSSGPGGGGGGAAPTLFYSRRIGLLGSAPVQVLAGGRLTGKVGAFDVGLLSIQTAEDDTIGAVSTNFTVARVKRNVFRRSNVGALFENRSASIAVPGESNRAWGADGDFGFNDEANLVTYYARSHTPRLAGNDQSYRARLNYDADLIGGTADYVVVGNEFNPELGFVRRRDFRNSALSARFSPRPTSIPWIRQISFQGDVNYFENDRARYVESRDRSGQISLDLENGDAFTVNATDTFEFLARRERISGALFETGRYARADYQASYRFGPQRRWQGNLGVQWGGFYTGERFSVSLGNGRVEVHPQLSIEPSLELNWLDLPQQTHSGQYNQHVARTRVTYTMTPRAYVSGLVQYSTGSQTVSGNFRLRWEWAPGSELFVVYTEDRNTGVLGERWSELSTRALVIKVTRLFRP
ncbi:MAG: hypothetical protein A3H97_08830 [Acidobacteria bacterium RIFCSPLOWO2_02_FULL_65_29]|nr:MAG: hypothetical protein A3H97_08830 [Acidobacteria bacterium RIFCSPLOWO2_02_FULL_65_29]